jgi:hypothetical protein
MVRTFLDLSEAKYDRPTLRRMEKQLKAVPSFIGKKERIFFFEFETEEHYLLFKESMLTGAAKSGEKTEIVYMEDPFIQQP